MHLPDDILWKIFSYTVTPCQFKVLIGILRQRNIEDAFVHEKVVAAIPRKQHLKIYEHDKHYLSQSSSCFSIYKGLLHNERQLCAKSDPFKTKI